MKHRHPSGRDVFLVSLSVTPTYEGFIEGTPERISEFLRPKLRQRVRRSPLALIVPDDGPLGRWMWIAELRSNKAVNTNDSDCSSRLHACWFTDSTNRIIDEVVAEMLPQIAWEEIAEDYDTTNI